MRVLLVMTRQFVFALFAATYVSASMAQSYPERPIHLIVPFAPGGSSDIVARLLAQRMTTELGQAVVVENRAGAGARVGTEAVVRSAADGYTLLLATPDQTINAALYNLPYDPRRDLTPISLILSYPLLVVASPEVKVRSIAELITLARAQPGSINYGSSGIGNITHLAMELLKSMASLDIVHVAYKGNGPAMTDLVAGRIQLMVSGALPVEPFLQSGKMRALAVTSRQESAVAPGVPPIANAISGYEVLAWFGLMAPAKTPPPVIAALHAAAVKSLADPDLKARLASFGSERTPSTPESFAQFLSLEIDKWKKLITETGIQPE